VSSLLTKSFFDVADHTTLIFFGSDYSNYYTFFFKLKYNHLIICVTESTSITEINEINPIEFYGSKVNVIECLENKLQSEFDKFCSVKKPVLWPGMAFNWDVPGSYDN